MFGISIFCLCFWEFFTSFKNCSHFPKIFGHFKIFHVFPKTIQVLNYFGYSCFCKEFRNFVHIFVNYSSFSKFIHILKNCLAFHYLVDVFQKLFTLQKKVWYIEICSRFKKLCSFCYRFSNFVHAFKYCSRLLKCSIILYFYRDIQKLFTSSKNVLNF